MMSPRKTGAEGTRPSASTGPRSAAGKARSSMNALKSGIYSKSETIPGEDPAALDALLEEYLRRYRPTLPEERDQVDILVRCTWTLRRLAAAEAQIWIYEMDRHDHLSPGAPLGHALHYCDGTLTPPPAYDQFHAAQLSRRPPRTRPPPVARLLEVPIPDSFRMSSRRSAAAYPATNRE